MARQGFRVKSNKVFWWIVSIVVFYGAVYWMLNNFIIRIGEDAIYYELGKSIIFIIFCISPIFLYFFKEFRKTPEIKHGDDYNPATELEQIYEENEKSLKENWERYLRSPNRKNRLPISLTLGQVAIISSIFLFFSIGGLVNCFKDLKAGKETMLLQDTYVTYSKDEQNGSYSKIKLCVGEAPNAQEYLVDEYISVGLIQSINSQHPYILLTYYPNTESIVQMDIYLSEGIVSIPEGAVPNDKDLELNMRETMSDEATKESYENVSLESLDLARYETISNITLEDALNDISPLYNIGSLGFSLKAPTDKNYETYESITADLNEKSNLSSGQQCIVLFKNDIALVIIYNSQSELVEDIYAVRCLYL